MAQHFLTYTVIHQPRRLRLPAQEIPRGCSVQDLPQLLFDEAMNRRYFHKVAEKCYHPATKMFLDLTEQGFKLSLGLSISFLKQCEAWDPELFAKLRQLI